MNAAEIMKAAKTAQAVLKLAASRDGVQSDVLEIGGRKFQAKVHGRKVYQYLDGERVTASHQLDALCAATVKDVEDRQKAIEDAAIDDLFGDGSQMEHRPQSQVIPVNRDSFGKSHIAVIGAGHPGFASGGFVGRHVTHRFGETPSVGIVLAPRAAMCIDVDRLTLEGKENLNRMFGKFGGQTVVVDGKWTFDDMLRESYNQRKRDKARRKKAKDVQAAHRDAIKEELLKFLGKRVTPSRQKHVNRLKRIRKHLKR